MKLSRRFLLVIVFSIGYIHLGFAQWWVNEPAVNQRTLEPGTYSHRIVGDDCPENVPTWDYHDRTGWNSDPYTQGHLKHAFSINPELNYRLLFPGYDPAFPNDKEGGYDENYSEGYPLIVMMHGAGERANCWNTNCYYPGYIYNEQLTCEEKLAVSKNFRNNDHNLVHGGYPHLQAVITAGDKKAEDPTLDPRGFPGFMLFAQNMNGWMGGDREKLYYIIRIMLNTYNIDPNRVYIHGLSNGGIGTIQMVQAYPYLFAAALPMSAKYSWAALPEDIVHHPMWIFQGENDNNPSVIETTSLVNQYRLFGGSIRYTEYANTGHGTWNKAYAEPDFFSWMLQHNKANMHVYFGDSTLCATDNQGIRLGVAQGFGAYQWRRDGIVMPDSLDEDIIVDEPGIYEVRFSRTTDNPQSESDWNQWSAPVEITDGTAETPDLVASGSTVLPDINGNENVTLSAPSGFTTYNWSSIGEMDESFIDLDATVEAGNYSVNVESLDGCPSLESEVISVLYNAPVTINTPGSFTATTLSSTEIRLFWEDLSLDEDGFELYRTTTTGSNYVFVSRTDADAISFTDVGLIPGTNYYYQIRAVSNTARSNYFGSDIMVTTPGDTELPTAPANLLVQGHSPSSVSLAWDPSTDNAGIAQYFVYYGSDSVGTGTNITNLTVSGLTINSTFTFGVRAMDLSGNLSPISNLVAGNTVIAGLTYEHSTGAWNSLTEIDWSLAEYTGEIDNFDISVTTQEDFFNFRYDGFIFVPADGNYTFYTNSDDGSRLYLGGFDPLNPSVNMIVDNDGLHGGRDRCNPSNVSGNCVPVFLTAGAHPITVIFFERTGGAGLTVSWAGPGFSKTPIADSDLKSGDLPPPAPQPIAPESLVATADAVSPTIDLTWTYNGLHPDDLDVVVLGSSTAAGTGATPGNSWVELLNDWLNTNTSAYNLTNLALGGYTTYDILPDNHYYDTSLGIGRSAPDPLRNITHALSLNPDIILINMPSNNEAFGIKLDSTMLHYQKIKSLADASGVKVYLTTTQPRDFVNPAKRGNLQIEAEAVRNTYGEYVIDIYDELTDFPDLYIKNPPYASGDGIHLNDAGHLYIFNTTVSTLERHLTNYQILRSESSGGPYSLISTTIDGDTFYQDAGLEANKNYYYVVRTINLNGTSVNSIEASDLTVGDLTSPTAPDNLTYLSANFTQVALNWTASTDNVGVEGYKLFQDDILVDTAYTNNIIVTDLAPNVQYQFKVSAFDLAQNESGFSNVLDVTTDASVVYHLQTPGLVHILSSWNTELDGSGLSPESFAYNGQYYMLNTSSVLTSAWSIGGEVSKVVIENNQSFDVNSMFTGKIEAKAGSTININSIADVSFDLIDPTSTIKFGAAITDISALTYGNIEFEGIGTTKSLSGGETIVLGNLTSNGIEIKGAPNNASILTVKGDAVINDLINSTDDNKITLKLDGSGSRNFNSDMNLAFHELKVENNTNITFSGTLNSEVLLGSLGGGGLTISTGSSIDFSDTRIVITNLGALNSGNEQGKVGLENAELVFVSSPTNDSHLYPMSALNNIRLLEYNVASSSELFVHDEMLNIKEYVDVKQGVVNTNGFLKFLSLNETTNAYVKELGTNGPAQIAGDVTIQRFMEGEGRIYRYISSAVSGATVAQLQNYFPVTGSFSGSDTQSSLASMFYYNEPSGGWIEFPDVSNTEELVVGRGYSPFIREDTNPTNFEISGELNQGTIIYALTPDGGMPDDGWNLIGNPYQSPVLWSNVGWPSGQVGAQISIRQNPQGQFIVFDKDIGDGIIAPGQSFWVQTTGATPTLAITEAAKSDNLNSAFYRTSGSEVDFIAIGLMDGTNEDLTYIKFKDGSEDVFKKDEDAFKRPNDIFNLFTLSEDDINLAINAVNDTYCSKNVRIGISNILPGSYSLRFDFSNYIGFGESFSIYDAYLDDHIDLLNNDVYSFDVTQDPESNGERFVMTITKPDVSDEIQIAETTSCINNPSVLLLNSQPGVQYKVKYIDNTFSQSFEGTGQDLMLFLDSPKLNVGTNTLDLFGGFSECQDQVLKTIVVEQIGVIPLEAESTTLGACYGEDIVVQLSPIPDGAVYRYYKDESLEEFEDFTDGNYILTGVIEPLSLYFAAVNEFGCPGEIISVSVDLSVLAFEPTITIVDDALVSNYNEYFAWYLNGDLLTDIGPSFVPEYSGTYQLVVDNGICVKYSEPVTYLVTSLESAHDSLISIYPNPLNGTVLNITGVNPHEIKSIKVMTTTGKNFYNYSIANINDNHIEISFNVQPTPGLYYLHIQGPKDVIMKKIIIGE